MIDLLRQDLCRIAEQLAVEGISLVVGGGYGLLLRAEELRTNETPTRFPAAFFHAWLGTTLPATNKQSGNLHARHRAVHDREIVVTESRHCWSQVVSTARASVGGAGGASGIFES